MKNFKIFTLSLCLFNSAYAFQKPSNIDLLRFYFPREDIKYQGSGVKAIWTAPSLRKTNSLVLTFDDGPGPYTNELLDILAAYNSRHPHEPAKATFFALGKNIVAYPEVAKRIVQEGHILASHDWDHDNNNLEAKTTYESELIKAVDAVENIYNLVGPQRKEIYYRFPYGEYGKSASYHQLDSMVSMSKKLYGENCINYVFWDIDTNDWVSTMKPEQIADNTFNRLPGVSTNYVWNVPGLKILDFNLVRPT